MAPNMTVPGIAAPDRYMHHMFPKEINAEIRALRPDDWHGILYVVKDYAVIALFIWLSIGVNWWFYPLSVLMIGAHQRGLSTILHDSAHGVLARSRWLNFLLGTFPTAWAIFQRHFAYKKSHVHTHHPFLGRADKDPDFAFFIKEGVYSPASDGIYWRRVVLWPLLGSKTIAYLKYLIRNRYQMLLDRLEGKARAPAPDGWRHHFDRWGFVAFWIAIAATAVHFDVWREILLFWIVPYLTTFHIIGWFIEMSEHCSSTSAPWVNVFMSRNRRSRHVEKWLTGINNDHHHLDHHLDPSTPFWLLPRAHAIRMRDRVYAEHCARSGGLFQAGPAGEPSILSLILEQNRFRHAALSGADAGAPVPAIP